MKTVAVLAPAKINLDLRVIGKRPDGFHNIWSLFQTVSLFDRVALSWPGIGRLHLSGMDVGPDGNLMNHAAKEMAELAARSIDFDMHLEKRIPVAAGLGGGSADAGAVIVALCRAWSLDPMSPDVRAAAARVGSDVPFFLTGGRAIVTGRGEQVTQLTPANRAWMLIATPDLFLEQKTRQLYGALTTADFVDPPTGTLQGSAHDPTNSFLRPLLDLSPDFADTFDRIATVTGSPFRLSGAGPSLFSLYPSFTDATRAAETLRKSRIHLRQLTVCRTVAGPLPLSTRETNAIGESFSG